MRKLLLFKVLIFCSIMAKGQDIVINKWVNATNDNDGGGDAVELLVIKDNLDIRGMVVQLNQNAAVPSYQFADIPLWQNLRAGTLVVLRRPRTSATLPDDIDPADFVLAVNMGASSSEYITRIEGTSTTAYFNASQSSLVVLRKADNFNNIVHAFCSGTFAANNATVWNGITAPKLKTTTVLNANSGAAIAYPLNPTGTIEDYNGDQTAVTTPSLANMYTVVGSGYELNNRRFIASLRAPVIASQANKSLFFDGTNDKVTIPANSAFNSQTAITLEGWINVPAWKSQVYQSVIISKEGTNTSGYALRCGDNGRLNFVVGNEGNEWKEISSAPVMATNTWYHVAGVFEGGAMRIYINGNLVGTTTSNTNIRNSSTNLLIGESAAYGGRYFGGHIDDVKVWTVARTQAQIRASATLSLPHNETGLMAYYNLNEGSGTIVANSSSALANTAGVLSGFETDFWKDGYVPLGADMSAETLLAPDLLSYYNGPSRVKAVYRNVGTNPLSSFTIGYQLNGGAKVVETINQTLAPGDAIIHTFNSILANTGETNTIKIFTTAATGNVSNDTLITVYNRPANNNAIIPIFDKKLHNVAGQTQVQTVTLPDNNAKYSQILMNISVDCPTGGCDPWDQPAKISLKKDGETYEIARFVTPYGKACGPWLVDVTNFKSLLEGPSEFESYIQVWGSSGWLLNVSLSYVEGTSNHPYQKVTRLWASDNWVYGDPAKSYDLPERTLTTNAATKELEMRMTITGHGQGNTDNAAEFSDKTHTIRVNGTNVATQRLWKEDCAQNSCSNQAGTWLYSRAGWCPGQAVNPYVLQLTPQLTAGQDIKVDYVLQDYTNELRTGYDGSAHTEPHYKVHAYLIEKSDVPYGTYTNLKTQSVTYPSSTADASTATPVKVMLKNDGNTQVSSVKLKYFINGELKAEETSATPIAAGGTFEYTFTTLANLTSNQPNTTYQIAVTAEADGDLSVSDDISSKSIVAPVVLPLNFVSFTAKASGKNNAVLTWKFNTTESHAQFDIEALDSKIQVFNRIATVSKNTQPGVVLQSTYTDQVSGTETMYYRIKHRDSDGEVKYSEIKSVTFSNSGELKLYPNPVKDEVTLELQNIRNEVASLQIVDVTGKLRIQKSVNLREGFNTITVPAQGLITGYYNLLIKAGKDIRTISFIKE